MQVSGNVRGKAVTWNDAPPSQAYYNELCRVAKRRIIWGINYMPFSDGEGARIVWHKHVPRKTNLSVCEIASYSKNKRVDCVDMKWQNINRTEKTIHPCQKPVALYEWLLKHYAQPGERILDTHAGSGSIVIACHNMGFNLVACEIDEDYYNAALNRYKQHAAQLRIGVAY